MVDSQRILTLITALIKNTAAGLVEWNETCDDTRYRTLLTQGSVHISKQGHKLKFEIRNRTGIPAAEVTADTRVESAPQAALQHLYDLVQQGVLDLEGILDHMMQELNENLRASECSNTQT